MNNKQVAHLWANQSKPSAKGSNFYFSGDTIYSYGSHFPIARIWNNEVIFFNSTNYSNTTSNHKSYVSGAIDYDKYKVIELPMINLYKPNNKVKYTKYEKNTMYELFHKKNLAYFEVTILNLHRSFKFSRKYKDNIQKNINTITEHYQYYCKMFSLKCKQSLIFFDREKYSLEVKAQLKKAEIEKKKKEKIIAIEKQNQLNIFFNDDYKIETIKYRPNTNFLKIVGEKCITNNGAEVPKFSVLFIAMAIQSKVEKEKIIGSKIGDFVINAFDEKGIKIGCHFFDTQEINRIIELFK